VTNHNIVLPEYGTKRNATPQTMTLTNNTVDYVHWDDPNELVDRLRLLDASRNTGNNAHDNEILSIIKRHGSVSRQVHAKRQTQREANRVS